MGPVEPRNLASALRVNERVLWRLNRLRSMSPAEIGHRVMQAAALRAEKWGISRSAVPTANLVREAKPWIHAGDRFDRQRYGAAAERIAAGRFDIFALEDCDLGATPRWNRDASTGIERPLEYGAQIDYRDSRRVGDIKYLWEPNRHLHLVTLAQAYALGGDEEHAATIRRHLESWFEACPYLMGPNWTSALEAGMRLVNWALAWQLLGGAHAPFFEDAGGEWFRSRWLQSIYQHIEFVRGRYSLHSSANNHLIGEAAGVYCAALAWPYWDASQEWKREARAILEREALLQNAPDGVNREQATSYQQFTFDLLLIPMLAARANGEEFPKAYVARLEAMLEYVASVMDVGGNVPAFGDADDGRVVRLDPDRSLSPYRSILATGALLFRRGDFKAKAGALDDKSRWLLGPRSDARYERLAARTDTLPVRRAFPDGGYYILGGAFETPSEVRLVVDAGPLGYQSIAAHGHADALSFTLSLGGDELLIDPGTYVYHTDRLWRTYFRGTSAHNTVRIDGEDQSQQGGAFLWLRKASAVCSAFVLTDAVDGFEGWHDGYLHLDDPVIHRRRIRLDKELRRIAIEDSLEMEGEHEVELFFHWSEGCSVEAFDGGFAVEKGGRLVHLRVPQAPGGLAEAFVASMEPLAGWVSRRFDVRKPCPTIRWSARIAGACVLKSQITY